MFSEDAETPFFLPSSLMNVKFLIAEIKYLTLRFIVAHSVQRFLFDWLAPSQLVDSITEENSGGQAGEGSRAEKWLRSSKKRSSSLIFYPECFWGR